MNNLPLDVRIQLGAELKFGGLSEKLNIGAHLDRTPGPAAQGQACS